MQKKNMHLELYSSCILRSLTEYILAQTAWARAYWIPHCFYYS